MLFFASEKAENACHAHPELLVLCGMEFQAARADPFHNGCFLFLRAGDGKNREEVSEKIISDMDKIPERSVY